MLMSIADTHKKRGRPATGVTPHQGIRIPADLLSALQSCQDDHPDVPSRAEMIRHILRDWLIGHGYLPRREDPEGAN